MSASAGLSLTPSNTDVSPLGGAQKAALPSTQACAASACLVDICCSALPQVFGAIAGLRVDLAAVEEQSVKPVETLISEAYQEIDKAVSKGVLKKNTGGRRKSSIAKAKRKLLIDAGLYTPA